MNNLNYKKATSKSGFIRIVLILTLPFIILFIAYVVYKLFFIPVPLVKGIDEFKFLPLNKTIKLHVENIKTINITAYQGGKKFELLKDNPETVEKIYTLLIKPKDLHLKNGTAIIIINAKAGILKEVKYEIKSVIDTVAPTLEVIKSPFIIYQGSGGFALLKAKDADSVFIKLEDKTFRAFKALSETDLQSESFQEFGIEPQPVPNSSMKRTALTYYVFFPAPFNIKEGSIFYAVARDRAGNQSVKALSTKLKLKKYKMSSININDSFINMVVSPLLNQTNISDPESAFKKVNEQWREKSLKRLINIARETGLKMLWEGRFLQLKNSKVMAVYGDKRTYFYNEKAISKSVHLGYDLASYANAPVEAANTGLVRFAGNLYIYGNTIIIDHGLGLMSLYGHLSTIMVKEGQRVKKGEIIAKTGSTGLAGGDHLHFGIIIHGYEVSPLYWWDPHWIRINVTEHLSPQN